jgi:hypothetical protein
MSKKAWKTGYYYSKQSSHELLMIDEESKVWIVPIHLLDYPALLDYPEVKNTALGSFTFGDYGLARKEIQEALHDTTESTVGIYLFKVNFSKCWICVLILDMISSLPSQT